MGNGVMLRNAKLSNLTGVDMLACPLGSLVVFVSVKKIRIKK